MKYKNNAWYKTPWFPFAAYADGQPFCPRESLAQSEPAHSSPLTSTTARAILPARFTSDPTVHTADFKSKSLTYVGINQF